MQSLTPSTALLDVQFGRHLNFVAVTLPSPSIHPSAHKNRRRCRTPPADRLIASHITSGLCRVHVENWFVTSLFICWTAMALDARVLGPQTNDECPKSAAAKTTSASIQVKSNTARRGGTDTRSGLFESTVYSRERVALASYSGPCCFRPHRPTKRL